MKDKKLSHRIRSKEIGTSVKVIPERSSVKRKVEKSLCPMCGSSDIGKTTLTNNSYACRSCHIWWAGWDNDFSE